MSDSGDATLPEAAPPVLESMPDVVDQVALARLYGEPLFAIPTDLYIPPDALEVFLEAFEGPLDLLLYLIRKQNFNILDIPMAAVTRQYLEYVADARLERLGLPRQYNVTNPFDFLELQDVQEVANFFERRVSAYQVGVVGAVALDMAF